jgi:hypothetical protein
VVAAFAPHLQWARRRIDALLAKEKVARQIVKQRMAALLRLQRQHEAAVDVDVDGLDRIHLDGDGETHGVANPSFDRLLRFS